MYFRSNLGGDAEFTGKLQWVRDSLYLCGGFRFHVLLYYLRDLPGREDWNKEI